MHTSPFWTTFFLSFITFFALPEAMARKHLCHCRGQTRADLTPHPGMTILEAMRVKRRAGAPQTPPPPEPEIE